MLIKIKEALKPTLNFLPNETRKMTYYYILNIKNFLKIYLNFCIYKNHERNYI